VVAVQTLSGRNSNARRASADPGSVLSSSWRQVFNLSVPTNADSAS